MPRNQQTSGRGRNSRDAERDIQRIEQQRRDLRRIGQQLDEQRERLRRDRHRDDRDIDEHRNDFERHHWGRGNDQRFGEGMNGVRYRGDEFGPSHPRYRDDWDTSRDPMHDPRLGNWGTGGQVQRTHSGWHGDQGHDGNRGATRGRGPKGYTRSDERIREDISDQLVDHDSIDASDVEITVATGIVTLSGTVPERRMKHAIEDLADSVRGVKDIINNIRVKRPGDELVDEGRENKPRRDNGGRATPS